MNENGSRRHRPRLGILPLDKVERPQTSLRLAGQSRSPRSSTFRRLEELKFGRRKSFNSPPDPLPIFFNLGHCSLPELLENVKNLGPPGAKLVHIFLANRFSRARNGGRNPKAGARSRDSHRHHRGGVSGPGRRFTSKTSPRRHGPNTVYAASRRPVSLE